MPSCREAKAKLTAGSFSPVYLLYGEESFLQEELQDLLAASFLGDQDSHGLEKVDGAGQTLAEALQRFSGGNLFAARRLLVIGSPPYLAPPKRKPDQGAGDAPEPLGAGEGTAAQTHPTPDGGDESAGELLERFIQRESARAVPDNILLFKASAVDRRKKLFKLINQQGVAVECAPLPKAELAQWIQDRVRQAGMTIERTALEQLLLSGDGNLWHISTELDKYRTYLKEGETAITGAVVELLYAGDTQGSVFKLADALSEGNISRALQLLQLLLSRREKPVLIFFMVVRHFRLLLAARALREAKVPPGEFAAALKVPPFAARKLSDQAKMYRRETLEEILIVLQKIDWQIKTGRLDPRYALELTLGQIHHLYLAMQEPDSKPASQIPLPAE